MQEEVEQKTFNIVVSTTKLTARTILNAGKAAIQQQQAKMAGGKQSVRMLLRQNRGVSSVEIDKTNIRGFERYAKKYGIDYAIRKDNSEMPPRYLVFFKAPDVEAFNAA
ncbi:PcfB family protein, partial [Faecalibacterium prausnitzii]